MSSHQLTDGVHSAFHGDLSHIENKVIVGGLVVIGTGKISIQMKSAFTLFVHDDLGLFTIKMIVFHHESYSIFSICDQKEMIGIRMLSQNILAATTDYYDIILGCNPG